MVFSAIIRGLLLGLPAAAQPGPLQAYLLGLTMRRGWRRALPAALAPLDAHHNFCPGRPNSKLP
jgi:threonine/homoserine/homoserine lactone efflux protein